MRWGKLKNIIIYLLVIVNASLLAMVGLRDWQSRRLQAETREHMLTLLERSGIVYLPEDFPDALDLATYQLTLAPLSLEEVGSALGTTPESYFYAQDGTMSLTFQSGALPLGEQDAGELGAALLRQLGVQAQEQSRETSGDTTTVQYGLLWMAVPVPEWTATLRCRGGSVTSLEFRRLAGTVTGTTQTEGISAATALARFLTTLNQEGYVCSQITAFYAGYTVEGSGQVELTPTWYIETDTRPWRFAIDGVNGTVSTVE